MAVDPNKRRFLCAYTSDAGENYAFVSNLGRVNAIGYDAPVAGAPTVRSNSRIPLKPRRVHAISTDLAGPDQRISVVIPSVAHDLWTGVANGFTVAGLGDFLVTGRSGEDRSRGAQPAP